MRATLKQAAAINGRLRQAGEHDLTPAELESARLLGVLLEIQQEAPADKPSAQKQTKRRKA